MAYIPAALQVGLQIVLHPDGRRTVAVETHIGLVTRQILGCVVARTADRDVLCLDLALWPGRQVLWGAGMKKAPYTWAAHLDSMVFTSRGWHLAAS